MFRKVLLDRRLFNKELGDSSDMLSSRHNPEDVVFVLNNIPDPVDKEQTRIKGIFEEEQQYWIQKMDHARSLEELEAWKNAYSQLSVELFKKTKTQSEFFHQCVVVFEMSCEEKYEERKKEVPAKTAVAKRLIWPSVGLFFAVFVVMLIVAPPFAPVVLDTMDFVLGGAMVGYTMFDAYNKKRVAHEHFNKDYSSHIKMEEGGKFFNASVGFGLAVVGAVALTGIFPPLGILIIAAIALVPVAIEIGIRYKAYHDTKQAIEDAKEDGYSRERTFVKTVNMTLSETNAPFSPSRRDSMSVGSSAHEKWQHVADDSHSHQGPDTPTVKIEKINIIDSHLAKPNVTADNVESATDVTPPSSMSHH